MAEKKEDESKITSAVLIAITGLVALICIIVSIVAYKIQYPRLLSSMLFITPILLIILIGACVMVNPEYIKTNPFVTSTYIAITFNVLFVLYIIYFIIQFKIANAVEGDKRDIDVIATYFLFLVVSISLEIISFLSTMIHSGIYVNKSQDCILTSNKESCSIVKNELVIPK